MVRAVKLARVILIAASVAAWELACVGCGVQGTVRLRSVADSDMLAPKIRVLAYRSDDSQSADVYMTDLSMSDMDPGVDPGKLTGTFIHIHQFLIPRAGRTPIESTASSATIRAIVLSRGAIGVYGGGGFLLPDGSPGDSTFGGTMKGATVKLIESNAQFHDPLGACTMTASFSAPLDESLARLMAARMDDFLAKVREK